MKLIKITTQQQFRRAHQNQWKRKKKKVEKSQLKTQTQLETKTETHARNKNPTRNTSKLETQSWNTSTTRNTKLKYKHSSKHKTEMPKIEKRGRNGSGRQSNVGRRRQVSGGWARADRRWVFEKERRVCGSVEEERRDGEAVRTEIKKGEWRKE